MRIVVLGSLSALLLAGCNSSQNPPLQVAVPKNVQLRQVILARPKAPEWSNVRFISPKDPKAVVGLDSKNVKTLSSNLIGIRTHVRRQDAVISGYEVQVEHNNQLHKQSIDRLINGVE